MTRVTAGERAAAELMFHVQMTDNVGLDAIRTGRSTSIKPT
jgi:hypothetical protein